MGTITTCQTNSFRQEIFEGGHCFFQVLTQTGNTHTSTTVDNLASTANLAVGMSVTGSGVTAGSVVANITSATALLLSIATGTSLTATSLTFTGDAFKMALIKFGPTGTYDRTTTNYSGLTTDEVTGTGYTAGGTALTQVNPSVPDSNTAIVNFSPSPSWTSATIDCAGCLIYNTTARISSTTGRAVSLHDFGGEQKTTAGTLTVNMPTANGTAAILRIS